MDYSILFGLAYVREAKWYKTILDLYYILILMSMEVNSHKYTILLNGLEVEQEI